MATGKKSFVLYCDLVHSIDILDNEQAGKLFKHILYYVNDLDPKETDVFVRLAFEPIKHQLKRDLKNWKTKKKKRSEAGRKGGLKTQANFKQNQAMLDGAKANQAVSGNGTVTVNVNDTVINGGIYDAEKEILSNKIQFEQICMKTKNNDLEHVKNSLRKFHLHLEENDKYPQKRKQVFAGFEKWLLNEKKNTHGNTATQTSGKHKGAMQLVSSLKQDFAARRKEDD